MQITLNLFVLLLGIIISSSFFAVSLLWFSAQNKQSNRFLALLILSFALWLTDHFLRISQVYSQRPNFYFLPIFYSFAFGPLVFFYTKSLTNPSFKLHKTDFIHFVPVTLQAGLYVFLSTQNYTYKKWYWENIHQWITYKIEFDGSWISLLIYLVFSINLLRKYQVSVANHYSETSKIHLQWLKTIFVILVILCCQWLIEIVLRDYFNIYFDYNYSIIILGIMSLVLAFGGIRQTNLEKIDFIEDTTQKNLPLIDTLTLEKIKAAMETKKLYLNPTLTLIECAKELKLSPKIVSQHINHGLGKPFIDFVNEYRVSEVKQRIQSTDIENFTLLGIAFESGFNSKTTFNRIFKDFTGLTPREFIK